MARLMPVPLDGRKLSIIGVTGRAHVKFTWSETEAVLLPDLCCVAALAVTEAGKDGITFELPKEERA